MGPTTAVYGYTPVRDKFAAKFLRLLAAALVAVPLVIGGGPTNHVKAAGSFVTRSGTQLLLDGQPFRFTGFNIYEANSDGWCGDTFSDADLRAAFDTIGSRDTVLRAWFFQPLAADKGPDGAWTGTRNWTRFDRTLAIAQEKGVHVIVTLANQWGECGDGGATGYKTQDWYLSGYKAPEPGDAAKYASWASYRDWVAEVVTRYKGDPTIMAWQLINEAEITRPDGSCPTGDPDDPMDPSNILKRWAQDVGGLIRSIDSNHLISLGTIGSGQCGTEVWQYANIHSIPEIDLCEFHDYSPDLMPGNPGNGLQDRINQCNGLNKPIFVGETGIRPTFDTAGGTLDDRAELFDAKFRAQFGAGVQGELVWDYRHRPSTVDNFDIGPGDPTLLRIQAWSPGCDPNNYKIVYTDEPHGGNPDLYLFDPVTGARRRITVDPDHGERQAAWSHDGKRLAYLVNGGSFVASTDLRTMNVDGSGVTHLVGSIDAPAFEPAWSPDGTQIAYAGSVQGVEQLSLVNADGTAPHTVTPEPSRGQSSPSWSPDGSQIAFGTFYNDQNTIKAVRPDGTGLTVVGSPGMSPVYSPDGSKIAFLNREFINGYDRTDIYVMNVDGTGRVNVTGSLPNGRFSGFGRPSWSGPGRLSFSANELSDWSDIYNINADGTGLANLTNTPNASETDAAWRPARTPPVICGPGPQPATPPDPPTNVVAAAGDGTATVTWQPPANNGGAELLDYWIFTGGNSVAAVPANETSAIVSGLTNGVAYTFTVRTQNIVGPSAQSAPSAPVTPQAGAPPPQTAEKTIPPSGGTATTDPTNSGPTPTDPVTTSVTVPAGIGGGTITIAETAVSETPPTGGYKFLGQEVDITSTAATSVSHPLTIVFTIDSSVLLAETGMTAPPPESVDVTRAEAGTPAVIAPCTTTSPSIDPETCVSDRHYVNGDLRITILTRSASHWNTAVKPVAVTVTNSGYSPTSVTVAQGGIVLWTFTGSKPHSATENLKLGPAKAPLFDSGLLTSSRYGYVIRAAGTYTYGSTVKGDPGSFAGSIAVPVRISPTSGRTTTPFTVTWSSSALSGYVFDVQYRFMKAGGKSWSPLKTWQNGVSVTTGLFTPSSGAGTYAFSARPRNAATGNAALWSPEATITVQ